MVITFWPENMPYVAQILPIYTPDGGVADPNHPVYALVWIVLHLVGAAP